MPELPDAEVARRSIARRALRRTIAGSSFGDERLLKVVTKQKIARGLKGRELRRTARRGKHIGAGTDAGEWLILHLGMTGAIRFQDAGEAAPKHAQLTLEFSGGGAMAFCNTRKLGLISWAASFDGYCDERGLGPDAIEIGKDDLCERLQGRSGSVKPLLMNQSVIAGVGNVYADETLFQCGIRPDRGADDVSDDERGEMWRVMRRVLRTAIRHGAKPDTMPDGWLLPVRSEKDVACPRCGGKLKRKTVSGRTAVFCSKHQR